MRDPRATEPQARERWMEDCSKVRRPPTVLLRVQCATKSNRLISIHDQLDHLSRRRPRARPRSLSDLPRPASFQKARSSEESRCGRLRTPQRGKKPRLRRARPRRSRIDRSAQNRPQDGEGPRPQGNARHGASDHHAFAPADAHGLRLGRSTRSSLHLPSAQSLGARHRSDHLSRSPSF